jgi:hypothetical protein
LFCNKYVDVDVSETRKDLSGFKVISQIINIEVSDDIPISHFDSQAEFPLIGGYLNYRIYTPDRNKESGCGMSGGLCSEKKYLPKVFQV